jgi:hypothetical protein
MLKSALKKLKLLILNEPVIFELSIKIRHILTGKTGDEKSCSEILKQIEIEDRGHPWLM